MGAPQQQIEQAERALPVLGAGIFFRSGSMTLKLRASATLSPLTTSARCASVSSLYARSSGGRGVTRSSSGTKEAFELGRTGHCCHGNGLFAVNVTAKAPVIAAKDQMGHIISSPARGRDRAPS
jgi:hypothetical protein